jgi:hypothetical protein
MSALRFTLSLLPETLAVCRLGGPAEIPAWAMPSPFLSVTRTPEELSIVCPERLVPAGISRQGGWRALRVEGPLDFGLTGVLASIAVPLAGAAIPIFALSTHDTDYVLIREGDLERALVALADSGHRVPRLGREA